MMSCGQRAFAWTLFCFYKKTHFIQVCLTSFIIVILVWKMTLSSCGNVAISSLRAPHREMKSGVKRGVCVSYEEGAGVSTIKREKYGFDVFFQHRSGVRACVCLCVCVYISVCACVFCKRLHVGTVAEANLVKPRDRGLVSRLPGLSWARVSACVTCV